jgi:hypothetical protein
MRRKQTQTHVLARAERKAKAEARAKAQARFRGTQFREALEKLGIPITLAGEYLDMSDRQPVRYGQDDSPVPGPLRKLLKLAIAKKLTADDLRDL